LNEGKSLSVLNGGVRSTRICRLVCLEKKQKKNSRACQRGGENGGEEEMTVVGGGRKKQRETPPGHIEGGTLGKTLLPLALRGGGKNGHRSVKRGTERGGQTRRNSLAKGQVVKGSLENQSNKKKGTPKAPVLCL